MQRPSTRYIPCSRHSLRHSSLPSTGHLPDPPWPAVVRPGGHGKPQIIPGQIVVGIGILKRIQKISGHSRVIHRIRILKFQDYASMDFKSRVQELSDAWVILALAILCLVILFLISPAQRPELFQKILAGNLLSCRQTVNILPRPGTGPGLSRDSARIWPFSCFTSPFSSKLKDSCSAVSFKAPSCLV